MSISISTSIIFLISLFLEIMSSSLAQNLSKFSFVCGMMSLSSSRTFLCAGDSAPDLRKSSAAVKGFSNGVSSFTISLSFWYPVMWLDILYFFH